jgi:hypothetical protein
MNTRRKEKETQTFSFTFIQKKKKKKISVLVETTKRKLIDFEENKINKYDI